MVNKITFIDKNKCFTIEFENFSEFSDFYFNLIRHFLIKVEENGIEGYGLEIPFKMDEFNKQSVDEYIKSYVHRNPLFNKILSFFNHIDVNECFYIFDSELPQEFCETCKESLKYYNKEYNHDIVQDNMEEYLEFNKTSQEIVDEISKQYEVKYHSYTKKIFLGEKNKKKRVCRFCGKTMQDNITFREQAHAIPFFMGNTTLFQNEECDTCNSYFGNTIEVDLDNYTKVFRIFAGIGGRNGIPEINSNGKKVFYSDLQDEYKGPVIISDNKNSLQNKIEIKIEDKYIPANVYKMFCKIFFSVVNYDIVKIFDDTIKWLRFDEYFLDKLPPIAYSILPNGTIDRPGVVTYIKKSKIGEVPFAFIEFIFGRYVYTVQIPSLKNKNELFYEVKTFNNFLKSFKHYENINFTYIDFSSKNKRNFEMNLNF